jgi:hypothetical protein
VETVDEVPVVPVPVVPEQPVIAPATGPAARRFLTSLASSGWRAPTAARPPPRSSRTPSRPALCRWSPSPPVSPPLTPSSRGPGCRRARRAGAAGRQGGHAPILAELDRLDPASIAILGGARAISDPIAIRLQTCTTGVVSRLAGGNRTQSPPTPWPAFRPPDGTRHRCCSSNRTACRPPRSANSTDCGPPRCGDVVDHLFLTDRSSWAQTRRHGSPP